MRFQWELDAISVKAQHDMNENASMISMKAHCEFSENML
jgi:hypothetical protein